MIVALIQTEQFQTFEVELVAPWQKMLLHVAIIDFWQTHKVHRYAGCVIRS